MKRSIISLCIFVLLIVGGTVSEKFYCSDLAKSIFANTKHFEGYSSYLKLKEIFDKRKFLNIIFIKETVTERIELCICELGVNLKYGNKSKVDENIEKINFYTEDLKKGRAF